jgi:hypothetical protein
VQLPADAHETESILAVPEVLRAAVPGTSSALSHPAREGRTGAGPPGSVVAGCALTVVLLVPAADGSPLPPELQAANATTAAKRTTLITDALVTDALVTDILPPITAFYPWSRRSGTAASQAWRHQAYELMATCGPATWARGRGHQSTCPDRRPGDARRDDHSIW